MKPHISVIILNWNNWGDTIQCLTSLYQNSYPNYSLFVVDNNSSDNSVEKINNFLANHIPVKFQQTKLYEITQDTAKIPADFLINLNSSTFCAILIKNKQNLGFAEGNNIAMRLALSIPDSSYILLLNNDTTQIENFLKELVQVAENDPKIGICGPKLLRMSDPNIIDSTGHVFKYGVIVDRGYGETDHGQYDKKYDVVGAIAACSLYRISMLNEIGLFDPEYFVNYEDADLSWRAYNSNWKGKYVPSSIVYHKRGGTNQKDESVRSVVIEYEKKNIIRTLKKNGSIFQKYEYAFTLFRAGIEGEVRYRLGKEHIRLRECIPQITAIFKD